MKAEHSFHGSRSTRKTCSFPARIREANSSADSHEQETLFTLAASRDASSNLTHPQPSITVQSPYLSPVRIPHLTQTQPPITVPSPYLSSVRFPYLSHTQPLTVILRGAPFAPRRTSTAALRDTSARNPCPLESAAKSTGTTAEQFDAQQWVRCRSGSLNTPQSKPECLVKSLQMNALECSCDNSTWHRVCNHNSRVVSVWNCSPSPAERSQAN